MRFVLTVWFQPAAAYWRWGHFLEAAQREVQAEIAYRKAQIHNPRDLTTTRALIDLLKRREAWNDIAEVYLQALDAQPEKRWWYEGQLWTALERTSRLPSAVERLQKAVQNAPDNLVVRLNLAETLTRQGDLDGAIDCYETANRMKFKRSYPNLVWRSQQFLEPRFIIIGAAKCGTSSLYSYLAAHPKVLPAAVKEINFWSQRFDILRESQPDRSLTWYLAHFPAVAETEGFATGEASPSYFASPEAPKRLYEAFPKVRLVVLLRNPVDRTISQYYDRVRRHQEHRPIDRAIETSLSGKFETEAEAVLADIYLRQSRYVQQLQHWWHWFPKPQIQVVRSEDLFEKPDEVANSVFEFLDLPPCHKETYRKYNTGSYPPVERAIRQTLRAYFQPDIERLEAELGRTLHWEPSL
ncbi:sulfotransferase domain-containing protein [Baaleninema sp.]|uniref:sulfotransferase domain-containing protein n=1 Tax=Baaleninema sp. TaxID=3101197 RepID=UPI003D095812